MWRVRVWSQYRRHGDFERERGKGGRCGRTVEPSQVRYAEAFWDDLQENCDVRFVRARGRLTHTSPQPYGWKCFENIADVLKTQVFARMYTGSCTSQTRPRRASAGVSGLGISVNARSYPRYAKPETLTQQMPIHAQPTPRHPRVPPMPPHRASPNNPLLSSPPVFSSSILLTHASFSLETTLIASVLPL